MENRQLLAERSATEWDGTQLRILDASERLIQERGVGGLTIAELARAAGVSRPTIYRTWSDADDVVRATLLHRVVALLEHTSAVTTRAELVEAAISFAHAFQTDPLYAALLAREPEVFTRYVLQRFGASQRAILHWLAGAIRTAQADGSIRPGPARDIAVMLLLIVQSAILSHGTVTDLVDDATWERELRFALDGHLRP